MTNRICLFPTFVSWLLLLACPLTLPAAEWRIDGSSTVYPVTVAIAGAWAGAGHAKIQVDQNGSGAGLKLLIAGTIPFADSSRAMTKAEVEAAAAHGVDIIEIPIAMDGITVVVNVDNTFVSSLTTKQLKAIWSPASAITTWAQVQPGYPDQALALFRPGNNSGTLEYFTTVIVGKAGAIRQDAAADEDFSVLTQGVIANRYAMSFCGWAYARANTGMLRQVAIDNGSGPQTPSRDSIISNTYPLSRPLFIYINKAALTQPEVADFVAFYLNQVAKVAEQVGYVALPDTLYARIRERVANRVAGSPFSLAPKGTSIEKALNHDFIPVGTAPVAAATAAPAGTALAAAPAAADPGQTSPATTVAVVDASARRATLDRLRDASLTLARLSLDQTATLEQLSRAASDARAAIDDLRAVSGSGSAPGSLTIGQALTGAPQISDEGYAVLVERLRLRPGSGPLLSDEALEGFKHDLRAVHDDGLKSQLAQSLNHVSPDNLPVFVESVAKMDAGQSWRAIDVVHCYALGAWTLQ